MSNDYNNCDDDDLRSFIECDGEGDINDVTGSSRLNSPIKLKDISIPSSVSGSKIARDDQESDHLLGAEQEEIISDGHIPDEKTVFFRDGIRKIDYILAHTDTTDEDDNDRRQTFLANLIKDGLELELEDKAYSQDGATYFYKVFIPWKTCLDHAELLKLKMPIQVNDIDTPLSVECWQPCEAFRPKVDDEEDFFTAPFFKDGEFIGYEGPLTEKPEFFSASERSRMAYNILQRARYGMKRTHIGISSLLHHGVFTAAYPLHDGPCLLKNPTDRIENKRQELYYEWATPKALLKEQPYDTIRSYFGEKVAFYFSWLGYYTLMLVPASIVGIAVFIYGLATMADDEKSNEICSASNVTMCPLCDSGCSYWKLSESCLFSKVTYVVDNPATIFFAVFMALWTALFVEFWKRRQARIQYDWDVAEYEELEESIRPQYEAKVTDTGYNPIKGINEPQMKRHERYFRVSSAFSFTLFLIFVVLAFIVGIIIYRMIIAKLIYEHGAEVLKSRARLITSATAAVISVLIITLLDFFYQYLAIWLTNLEVWKYSSQWEDAFTFKMYIFQFVNYYGTIIYIAFFKGQFVGYPRKYSLLVSTRLEECDPAGCLIELAIQLANVMVGKQIISLLKEVVLPRVLVFIKSRRGRHKEETATDKFTSWERDYNLVNFPEVGLYSDYLKLVIQYGFVTLFVVAFPLAPLFALLNNIVEIRLDALKLVTKWKRPMAERSQDIGTWFFVLKIVSKLAILVNACIIAFTSEFVKKVVYDLTRNDDVTYIDWSLSSFQTSDFMSNNSPSNYTEIDAFGDLNRTSHICRYRDFRSPPSDAAKYEWTETYWHVAAARLAFVLIFEHVVFSMVAFVGWLIPNVPPDVRDRMLREKYLIKKAAREYITAENNSRQHNLSSKNNVSS